MNTLEQRHADPLSLIGKRLDVLLCEDDSQHKGTLVALTGLTVDGEVVVEDMPQIKLDDGRTVQGIECWWTLENEDG